MDALIDEVRAIRREIARNAGNDVDRLCDELVELERRYDARIGEFADDAIAADSVAASWDADATAPDSR